MVCKDCALAQPAIEAVKTVDIKFVPEQYEQHVHGVDEQHSRLVYLRQLWWGHRIPAWYDAEGNVYVGRDEAEVRAKNNIPADVELSQDEDVLDTWFSSALWTFSTFRLDWRCQENAENYFLKYLPPN